MPKISANFMLQVVVNAMTALVFPATYDGNAHPFAGQLVFLKVKGYDLIDIDQGLLDLLVFESRAALVVITEEEQSCLTSPDKMIVGFHYTFSILSTDRSYVNREAALSGDAETPGVLMINDALVRQCMGEIVKGVVCEPRGGDQFALQGKVRDENVGRIAWSQVFRVHAGTEERSLTRYRNTFVPGA